MTTNREWLYSLDVADLSDWLDAEHADEPCTFQAEKVHGCAESVTNLEWMYRNNKSFREYCQLVLKEHPLTFAMTFDTNEDAGEWLMAPHMDAQRDNNGTCPNDNETASNGGDSREKLEADAIQLAQNIWHQGQNYANGVREVRHIAWQERDVIELLDRQAAITSCECAKINSQRLGELHSLLDEAAEEREKLQEEFDEWKHSHPLTLNQLDSQSDAPKSGETAEYDASKSEMRDFDDSREKLEADITSIIRNAAIWARQKIERGEGSLFMLDKYDPMIRELLDRQAAITRKTEQAAWIQQANGLIHEANVRADELQHDYDVRYSLYVESCKHITELEGKVDRLEAERDALAADLRDCEQQREWLRQALGIAIDHAHEIMSLVNLDGEVIG